MAKAPKPSSKPTEGDDRILVYQTLIASVDTLGGNDVVFPGAKSGHFNGGSNSRTDELGTFDPGKKASENRLGDTLSYGYYDNSGVVASLQNGAAVRGPFTDTISNFENLVGSGKNDTLEGNVERNYMAGHIGSDSLSGLGGNDILFGLYPDAKPSKTADLDFLYGGDGNDYLVGGPGIDHLDGGSHQGFNDIFSFSDSVAAIQVHGDAIGYESTKVAITADLGQGFARIGTSAKEQDTVVNVESVFGGLGADDLTGNATTNTLLGRAGDDELFGAAGDDGLYGGIGDDLLEGGEGDDWLFGESGDDLIRGGNGFERLWGGLGRDTFEVGNGIKGTQVILDFDDEAGDELVIPFTASELDANGDGRINLADNDPANPLYEIRSYTVDIKGIPPGDRQTADSLVILNNRLPSDSVTVLFDVTEILASSLTKFGPLD